MMLLVMILQLQFCHCQPLNHAENLKVSTAADDIYLIYLNNSSIDTCCEKLANEYQKETEDDGKEAKNTCGYPFHRFENKQLPFL